MFKSTNAKRIAIAFAIDGRASEEHEIEYERSGAAPRSRLFGAMFNPDKRRREIQAVAREFRKDIRVEVPRPPETRSREVLSLPRRSAGVVVAAANVRVLSVYDHPPLLRSALEDARQRLLIVSPWIRANVVDAPFMKLLGNCLERGVRVTIGYGIDKKDPDEKHRDKQEICPILVYGRDRSGGDLVGLSG